MLPPLKSLARRVRIRRPSPTASIQVRLPDGRSIAVEEYGDPTGPLVLYFHGWPACRLEAGLIEDLPVRLLAFDRPGYGRSSPAPGRTLLDWPNDVEFVADQLGLGSFHLVGLSGGGPYATACAYALPHRVTGLALVSPVPPPEGVPHRAPGIGHLMRLGRHPRLAHRLIALARPLVRQRIITPRTIVGRGLKGADRDILTRSFRARLGRVWREGFARGIHGALSDAQIYAQPWGFALASIQVPTSLWCGAQDSLIPPEALAPYAAIPGLRRHLLEHEGHYSLAIRHADAILADLLRDRTGGAARLRLSGT